MVKKIQDGLKSVDLFGQEVKLNYQNDDQFKSSFGGFFTLLFITLLIVLFWTQIKNFVLMQDVTVASETSYNSDPSKILIDPKEMIFALKISQDNFVKRPYFNVTLQDRFYYREDNGEQVKVKTNVDLVQCTKDHFAQLNDGGGDIDWLETYEFIGLDDFLCLPLDYVLHMGGMYTSEEFYFQKITVQDCVNSTDTTDPNAEFTSACATEQEIADFVMYNDVTFTIYFPNLLVNPDNPDEPIQHFLFDEVFFDLQPNQMYKTANIMFKKLTLETDQSLFPWSDNQSEEMVIFEPGDFREFNQLAKGDGIAGEFYFRRSGYDLKYTRAFRKLDDIVAYLGGFIEFVIIGATFFIGYYNDLLYSLSLANKLYNFQLTENQNDDDNDDDDQMKMEKLRQQEWKNKKKGIAKSLAVALRNASAQQNNMANNLQNQQQQPQSQQQNIIIDNKNNNQEQQIDNKDRGSRRQSLSAGIIKQIILKRQSQLQNIEKITDVEDENNSFSYVQNKPPLSQGAQKQVEKSNFIGINKKNNTNDNSSQVDQPDQSKMMQQLQGTQQNNKGVFSFNLIKSTSQQQEQDNNEKLDLKQPMSNKENQKLQDNQKDTQQTQNQQNNNYLGVENQPEQNQNVANQNLITFQDQYSHLEKHQQDIVKQLTTPQTDQVDINEKKKKKHKKHKKHHKHKKEPETQQKEYFQNQDNKYKEKKTQKKDNTEDLSYMNITKDFNKNGAYRKTSTNSTKAATEYMKKTKTKSKYDPQLYEGLGFTSRKEFLTKQFEEIVNRNSKLFLTWRFFLNKLFMGKFFKCEEVILIEKAKEMIRKELDIYYIIDQIKDIDKLKNVFLNKEQQTLFNFFPRPVLKAEDETLTQQKNLIPQKGGKPMRIEEIVQINKIAQQFKQQLAKKEFKHVSAFQSLYEAYEILMKQTNSGHIKSYENQRLIQLLGEEMKEIFETSKLIKFDNESPQQNNKHMEKPVQYYQGIADQNQYKENTLDTNQFQNKPQNNLKKNNAIRGKQTSNQFSHSSNGYIPSPVGNFGQNLQNNSFISNNDFLNETDRIKQKESSRQLLQDQSNLNLKDDYSQISNNQNYIQEFGSKQNSMVKQNKNNLQEIEADQIRLSFNNSEDEDICNVENTNREDEERPKTKEIGENRNNNINNNFMKSKQDQTFK